MMMMLLRQQKDSFPSGRAIARLGTVRQAVKRIRSPSARRRLQDELAEEESDEDGCYDDQERGERAGRGLSSNQRAGVGRCVFAALELSQSQALVLMNTNKPASVHLPERCIMGSGLSHFSTQKKSHVGSIQSELIHGNESNLSALNYKIISKRSHRS